jgi:drug/metabolite transporter (DMT)-like permease
VQQHRKIQGVDWITFTALSAVWGFSFYFIKKGLEVFAPVQVAAFRMAIAFVALVPLMLLNVRKLRIPASKWKFIPLLGLFGNLIPAVLFCTAETKIDSGLTGIMNSTTPLFALLAGNYFFRVPLTQNKIIGVITGFAGVLIIVLSKQKSFADINLYILLPLLATICYGINANIFKANFQGENPVIIALLQYTCIAPAVIGYLYFSGAFHIVHENPVASWHSLRYLLILGVCGTAYAQVLFNILTQRTSALFATMTTYCIPLISVMVGMADGENIHPVHIAGLIVILLGVYIGSRN